MNVHENEVMGSMLSNRNCTHVDSEYADRTRDGGLASALSVECIQNEFKYYYYIYLYYVFFLYYVNFGLK